MPHGPCCSCTRSGLGQTSALVVEARLRRDTRVSLRWLVGVWVLTMASVVVPLSASAQTTSQAQANAAAVADMVPHIRSAAAIIYNPQTGDVLWENNSHDQRSIASLTKIMTAVAFVADNPDLERVVIVQRADVTRASVTYLRAGERVSVRNLLHLTLIASDNAAARVLARVSPGGSVEFIHRMNDTAAHMGLTNTHYADPSGLDARNVSSAYDLSHLIAFATSHPTLGPIMRSPQFTVHAGRRTFNIRNTNKLLGSDVDVVGGKTGFIRKAGYCLATLLQVPQGSQVAVVVLGATNSAVRFAEARNLFNWAVVRTTGLLTGVPVADAVRRP